MMLESCLLRKVFGRRKGAVTRDLIKLCSRELHNVCPSSVRPVVKVIKCRNKLAKYVAHVRK
jgi:hypothetical protein